MKPLLTLAFILSLLSAPAQSIDSCGLDSNPELSTAEAKFFNRNYMSGKEGFDFTGKKIAFVTGSAGTTIINKATYFSELRQDKRRDTIHGSWLVVFTPEEKTKSGGYDGVITYWSKALMKGKKWLVKRLSPAYKPRLKTNP